MKVEYYRLSKEEELRSKLNKAIQDLAIQSLTIDYTRKDDKIFKTVYFKVHVIGSTAKDKIPLLDLSDSDREDVINMIVFARRLCDENKIKFENKFAQDGYIYSKRTISRELRK